MRTTSNLLLTAAAAFSGGLLAGLLFAPQSGRRARAGIARRARGSHDWLTDRFRAVETRLGRLEDQVQDIGEQLSERLRTTTSQALDQVLPGLPEGDPAWSLDSREIARELRDMPH